MLLMLKQLSPESVNVDIVVTGTITCQEKWYLEKLLLFTYNLNSFVMDNRESQRIMMLKRALYVLS